MCVCVKCVCAWSIPLCVPVHVHVYMCTCVHVCEIGMLREFLKWKQMDSMFCKVRCRIPTLQA